MYLFRRHDHVPEEGRARVAALQHERHLLRTHLPAPGRVEHRERKLQLLPHGPGHERRDAAQQLPVVDGVVPRPVEHREQPVEDLPVGLVHVPALHGRAEARTGDVRRGGARGGRRGAVRAGRGEGLGAGRLDDAAAEAEERTPVELRHVGHGGDGHAVAGIGTGVRGDRIAVVGGHDVAHAGRASASVRPRGTTAGGAGEFLSAGRLRPCSATARKRCGVWRLHLPTRRFRMI
mmetsp:Transcript_39526/g.77205  ORF Transcript_39526/g.77205 Transcript_39526/m.77205 type:complete len:234 (+) Transcript_39526:517-1218(+)